MLRKDISLIAIFCYLTFSLVQGRALHKHKNKHNETYSKHSKNVPRSALIGIHPDDLKLHPAVPKDVSGSRKSFGRTVNLPAMEETQVMNSLSGKLSHAPAGEQRLISDFLKDMDRTHGELTPSVMRKVVLISGYQPVNNMYQSTSRVTNVQSNQASPNPQGMPSSVLGSQRSLDASQPTLAAANPSPLAFNLAGKRVYQNTPSNIGQANAKYNSDPMPEYSYKETKYNLPTTSDSRFDDDYRDKDFHDDSFHGNSFHDDDYEYSKVVDAGNDFDADAFNPDESKVDGIGSVVGKKGQSLINEIGRKVLLKILQNQNDGNAVKNNPSSVSETSDAGEQNDQVNLDKIVALLTTPKKASADEKIAQMIDHLGLTNTRKTQDAENTARVTQETRLPVATDLNPPRFSSEQDDSNQLTISGKLNNVIEVAKVTPTSKTVTMTTPGEPSEQDMNMQNDQPISDGDVILKISGRGKPVSFKADTSTDGSLVLKIPKKYSEDLIKPNGDLATGGQGIDEQSDLLNRDIIKLLAGKLGKGNEYAQAPAINPRPTTRLTLPSLSSLLQYKTTVSQPDPKHVLNKNIVLPPQGILPSTAGLSAQQALNHLDNTPQSLVKSVFPGLAGLPPNEQNIESLMTLLTRMDQLPSSYVPGAVSAYTGTAPVNYAVRHAVGTIAPSKSFSMKGVLKASELAEDSAVARNKGITNNKSKADNEWSPCTVTCGEGLQARATPCQGKHCSGYATETRACNAGPCPEQLAKAGLKLHNTFRVWHHSPALKWSSSLAKKAQKLADDLAQNQDPSMTTAEMKELPGENIAVLLAQDYNTAAETATRQWYGEVKWYNFLHPAMTDETRHFTQIVWKSTKKAGIGISKSKLNQNVYVVALYDPPGDIESQGLKRNVKMPDTTQT